MNQIQIGRFIAASRKARNLTQRQLADKLGISDKTVSKWECGKGLPEVSLMLPCALLWASPSTTFSPGNGSAAPTTKKKQRKT
ncbi:MAG: helix-turn-helix domain-containing protein [Oscillospiraceae bacterium]